MLPVFNYFVYNFINEKPDNYADGIKKNIICIGKSW